MEGSSTETGLRQPSRAEDRDQNNYQFESCRLRPRYEPRPGGDYCPTPEEIAAECRKIQGEWSDRERWRRAGYAEGRPVWEVPTHHVTSLAAS